MGKIAKGVDKMHFSMLYGGGSQNLERPNIERPVFRKFETSNIEIFSNCSILKSCYCSKLNNFRNLMFFEIEKFGKFLIF